MSSEIERLLEAAPALARAEGPDAEDAYWLAVTQLHAAPIDSVFDRCRAWAASHDPDERRLAADVLGQLGFAARAYPFRSVTLPLLNALLSDASARVLQAALTALGHLGARESIPAIARLAQHPDSSVRHAVAFALLAQPDGLAVSTLISLSRDEAVAVRDWATFGLGSQLELDTPALRDALLTRLDDPDPDTRAEAVCGLAKRGDQRAVAHLRRILEGDNVGTAEVEAARDLGSPELLEPLMRLRTRWLDDSALLESAISHCAMRAGGGSG